MNLFRGEEARDHRLAGFGVRFLLSGDHTAGRFALVEHPLGPHALAAPLHRHTREDEYSLVLSGRIGAELGTEVVFAEPGDLIRKPAGQWHTFWNASDGPARVLEIIAPAGFEGYFEELFTQLATGEPDLAAVTELGHRYGVEFDFTSLPRLLSQHGASLGQP